MKKTLEGQLFNRIEILGGKEYRHVGFEDHGKQFGDILETFVPEVGMTKKAKITIELIEE